LLAPHGPESHPSERHGHRFLCHLDRPRPVTSYSKGPFADKFVTRLLREIISSETVANDGFGFSFLMLPRLNYAFWISKTT
jgi:hypothetical protein